MTRKQAKNTAIILFPLGGCKPEEPMTEAEYRAKMRKVRQRIRLEWNNDGVKAMIELMEITGARLQKEAIMPGADAHDQGQAFGVGYLLEMMRQIRNGEENEETQGHE